MRRGIIAHDCGEISRKKTGEPPGCCKEGKSARNQRRINAEERRAQRGRDEEEKSRFPHRNGGSEARNQRRIDTESTERRRREKRRKTRRRRAGEKRTRKRPGGEKQAPGRGRKWPGTR